VKNRNFPGVGNIFLRVFPPVAGSLFGTLLALVFFLVLKIISGDDENIVFSRFLLLSLVFISALAGNILAILFWWIANREKIPKPQKATTHVFLIIFILFLLNGPFFLILPLETGFKIANFFLLFSVLASVLIFELASEKENIFLAAQKSIIAGFFLGILFPFLFPNIIPNEMMIFFAGPISWLIASILSSLVEIFISSLQYFKR